MFVLVFSHLEAETGDTQIYILPDWMRQLFTGALYKPSGFCSTKHLNRKNLFENLKKTCTHVSKPRSYSNHRFHSRLTVCREGSNLLSLEKLVCITLPVCEEMQFHLAWTIKIVFKYFQLWGTCIYCGYFPRCLSSSYFVVFLNLIVEKCGKEVVCFLQKAF